MPQKPSAGPGRPLSIVHVTTFYPPENFGGDGVHVQRLAHAQARRGHDVAVIHAPAAYRLLGGGGAGVAAEPADADAAAPRVHRLEGAGSRIEPFLVQQTGVPVLSRRRLRGLLEPAGETGPDVIHYHNVSLVGGVGVFALGRCVKLFTPHEYWLVCPTHLLFRYGREPCQRRTCVRCTLHSGRPPQLWRYGSSRDRHLSHVDHMLFPSELTRAVYREQGIGLPGEVLHHFLPTDYLAAARARGERSDRADPYFLYVGRLDAVKGIERLLEAFAGRPVSAPLLVAGDGPLGPELRGRYSDHPDIRFLGSRTQEELGTLYRDALGVVLPSAGYEVFGLVVAEGFAHATPAVVSSTGGARELVEGAGAGAVFTTDDELAEALRRLASEPDYRREAGLRGRRFASDNLSEEAYLTRYEATVAQLLAARQKISGASR